MISRLSSAQDLIDYTIRRLGGDAHNVEIGEDAWEDIIYDARRDFHKYTDDGSLEKLILVNPEGNTEMILDDSVLSIMRAYEPKSSLGISNVLLPLQDTIYYNMVRGNATGHLSSYVVTKQYIETIHQLVKEYIWFDFNPETKQLLLGKPYTKEIAFEVFVEADESLIWNHKFMKRLTLMYALREWASLISGKYRGVSVGNGLELNSDGMIEWADKIQDELDRALEDNEYGGILGPRTTR